MMKAGRPLFAISLAFICNLSFAASPAQWSVRDLDCRSVAQHHLETCIVETMSIPASKRAGLSEMFVSWPEDAKLGRGDRLHISIFGHPDMDQYLDILSDGTTIFPMIGSMPVADQTLAEFKNSFTKRLAEFLIDPKVEVVVIDVRLDTVSRFCVALTETVYVSCAKAVGGAEAKK